MKNFKIFAINPGSTSTKIALFEGEECLFTKNISHGAEELKSFKRVKDQLGFRKDTIIKETALAEISLNSVDAFVGRGGGLMPLEGGVYEVNDKLLEDARACIAGEHPATLGAQIANEFAEEFSVKSFVVNPPDVDEFKNISRITGLKGVFRESRIHALNQKEIGMRYADEVEKRYEDINLIIAHIGGGISVTAHEKGKMIDSNDVLNGDGPMAPTRCGFIPLKKIIKMCFSGEYTKEQLNEKLTKSGGLVDHLETSDVKEILERINKGDSHAKLVFDAMVYQIAKEIGSMSVALEGKVDSIILTGGISNSSYVTEKITSMTKFIAPVRVMAGEFEMEALA
ncbi:MAG: butyrate kinase, partial [Clostridiales bacterium]